MTNARGPSSESLEETAGGDACVCSMAAADTHDRVLGLVATLIVGLQAYPWLSLSPIPRRISGRRGWCLASPRYGSSAGSHWKSPGSGVLGASTGC